MFNQGFHLETRGSEGDAISVGSGSSHMATLEKNSNELSANTSNSGGNIFCERLGTISNEN